MVGAPASPLLVALVAHVQLGALAQLWVSLVSQSPRFPCVLGLRAAALCPCTLGRLSQPVPVPCSSQLPHRSGQAGPCQHSLAQLLLCAQGVSPASGGVGDTWVTQGLCCWK